MKHVEKPWGYENWIYVGPYVIKELFMKAGHKCSLQFHSIKQESILVLTGSLKLHIGPDKDNIEIKILNVGERFDITPGMVHRMEGYTDCLYQEVSTPELDDLTRIQDDYNRS